MKTLLVTGATGLIGRRFLELLPPQYKIIKAGRSKGNDLLLDLSTDFINKLPSRVDMVIHMAAGHNESMFEINTKSTKKLVDYAKKCDAKFIYISSMAAVNKILNDYGLSKRKAEEYIINSGIKYLIFRPSMVFSENANALKSVADQAMMFPFFSLIVGNGKNNAMPVHLDDVASTLVKAVKDDNFNNIYFICGKEISMNDFVSFLIKKYKKKRIILHLPLKFVLFIIKIGSLFLPKLKEFESIAMSMAFSTKVQPLPEYYKFKPRELL